VAGLYASILPPIAYALFGSSMTQSVGPMAIIALMTATAIAPLRDLLLRHTQALINQIGQTAACNRHHSLEQRLCRWLLMCLDRLPEGARTVVMTQEMIAGVLGVRREGVTRAAGHLYQAGLIVYHRGRLTVLDQEGLRARACECYAVMQREYRQRLAPGAAARRSEIRPRTAQAPAPCANQAAPTAARHPQQADARPCTPA